MLRTVNIMSAWLYLRSVPRGQGEYVLSNDLLHKSIDVYEDVD